MNKFGIKISNKGYDVKMSKDKKILFDSENDTIQIYKKVPFEIVVPINTQGQTIEVKHDLPFAPLFACWSEDETKTQKYLVPSRTINFYTSAWSTPGAISINFSSQAPGWYADRDYIFSGYLYIFRVGLS